MHAHETMARQKSRSSHFDVVRVKFWLNRRWPADLIGKSVEALLLRQDFPFEHKCPSSPQNRPQIIPSLLTALRDSSEHRQAYMMIV